MHVLAFFVMVSVLAGHLSGCSGHTREYAARGATHGAVAGAVGGLLSSVVFGGDPLDRAARGAVVGAGVGATSGAMVGSEMDRRVADRRKAEEERIRREIGEDSFEGLAALAECRYEVSLRRASKAVQSTNRDYALAGLWLEVLTYSDQREESRARALYPNLIEKDPLIKNEAQAEQTRRKFLQGLMEIRAEYGLPQVCPA